MIDDDSYVYVNGRRVGESHVWQQPAVFDIKSLLHEGENSIAVGIVNQGGPGGINKGVAIEYWCKPIPPNWQRSVFNGFAQVLVQSAQQPGEIKLTASARDLAPTTMTIQSQECLSKLFVAY